VTLTGEQTPYNLIFTTNGIACTTLSVIAAVLGITDIYDLSAEDVERIKQVHLMLAMFNALQPGVFAISGWDLAGSLPLRAEQVEDLMGDGDTRWIHRGAFDLMGRNPNSNQSAAGMPKAVSLYGTLPEQLEDERSFARRLKQIIDIRNQYGIATAHQLDVPDVSHKSMLVMVHHLSDETQYEVTVLNFGGELIAGSVSSEYLPAGATVTDMMSGELLGVVDDLHTFGISLGIYSGRALLVQAEPTETA
jgi:trehalose synthase